MPHFRNVQKNIRYLEKENERLPKGKKRSQKQIIAIAYNIAKKTKKRQ